MHVETAAWTRAALERIELPERSRALDIGSSTLHYRTVEQPHIERASWIPVRRRLRVPLPGIGEQVRRRVPALGWRQTCVIMLRP